MLREDPRDCWEIAALISYGPILDLLLLFNGARRTDGIVIAEPKLELFVV